MKKHTHPQTPALAPWGVEQVDARIAPLMEALWALGIQDRCSCQESDHRPGMAFVGIDDVEHVQVMLAAVGAAEDLFIDWAIDGWVQPDSTDLIFDVHIPHEQVEEVTRRLIATRERLAQA